ncbi:MAG: SGNH/GDSL hydrolase family protein [Clostridiales bacterium]|nr:SGNH/GDSL hydrolase family protein [Clostridiales bacterium]
MELHGLKINFLGDSITEGHGTSAEEKQFTSLIASQYGAISRCYGIGGTRLARQHKPSENPRHDLDFPSRVAEMDTDADVIAVFGGTNDFGHGDAPFGTFSDRSADTFCGALHVLFTSLLEKYPEATILVMTPLHRSGEDVPNMHGRVLKDYVDMIRRAAEYYSLPVLDLFAESGIQPAVPVMKEKYMPDGLHPNDAGHAILTDRIAKFIMNL